MSRSYKKAITKYAPRRGAWGKRAANRKVRRTKNLPNGKGYRKAFESWDIHDDIDDSRFPSKDTFYQNSIIEAGAYLPKGAKLRNGIWTIPK